MTISKYGTLLPLEVEGGSFCIWPQDIVAMGMATELHRSASLKSVHMFSGCLCAVGLVFFLHLVHDVVFLMIVTHCPNHHCALGL